MATKEGWQSRFFEGDTTYSQSEVLEKQESRKRFHYLDIFPGRNPSNG